MGLVNSIGEYGVKRANPVACPTNFTRFNACEKCSDAPTCEDTLVIPKDSVIVSYNLDGKDYTTYLGPKGHESLSSAASNESDTSDKIFSLIYNHENKVKVDVVLDDTNLTITHIGQCRLKSVTLSDGTVIEAVSKCDLKCICTYEGNVPGSDKPTLVITKYEEELVNKALTGDYTDVTEANATALQTELATCWTDGTFTVTVDTVTGTYVVNVSGEDEFEVVLGGKKLADCGCKEVFEASK